MTVKILAIDTSTENCSVALLDGDALYTRSELAPRGHADNVLPMVDSVLKEAQLSLNDLDALAFGRGPGSFTGVRIGIGMAQGLAFGADLPMIGISTLQAMAQASYRVHGATHVACAIDARMSEVYWGRFELTDDGEWRLVEPECVVPPQVLAEQLATSSDTWVQAGTGWAAYTESLAQLPINTTEGDVLYPEAEDIVILAKRAYAKGEFTSAEHSEPTYLRDNVAWKKQPKKQ
jgi:tRNA threonylcarbamoyladenosine biosynthesis protein TsaB